MLDGPAARHSSRPMGLEVPAQSNSGPGRLREQLRTTCPFFFGEPGRRGSGRCAEDAGKALNHRRSP